MKFIIGLFASISSLFFSQTNKPDNSVVPPLNTAIISFQDTYYTPTVADPDNLPKAKSVVLTIQTPNIIPPPPVQSTPLPPPTPTPTPPPPPPPAPIDTGDPYIPQNIPFVDQSTQWLKIDFSLNGNIYDNAEHSLSNITMDREYWKVDVFTYWAPGILPPRPPLEKDYFKLEIYDEKAKKVIYTMTSGNEENIHKSQIFKKAGKYTFKAFAKTNGKYEITFLVSPKMAK